MEKSLFGLFGLFGAGLCAGASQAASPNNYVCKNAEADWPMPCKSPFEGRNFKNIQSVFTTAWSGPLGYVQDSHEDMASYEAYVAANFSNIQLSGRAVYNETWEQFWPTLQGWIARAKSDGMSVLLDTYTPLNRTWNNIDSGLGPLFSGFEYVSRDQTVRATPPQMMWLAEHLGNFSNFMGILVSDDIVDMSQFEIEAARGLREKYPDVVPWANSCGDGTSWLSREGVAFYCPEIYEYNSLYSNRTDAVAVQSSKVYLNKVDTAQEETEQFGLTLWVLLQSVPLSASVLRFQAYSALAYNAKALHWFCYKFPSADTLWNTTTNSATPALSCVAETNSNVRAWGEPLANYSVLGGVFHTGWAASLPTTLSPGQGLLVEAMSDQLLVGVLAPAAPAAPAEPRDQESLLAVVVDKRVTADFAGPAGRPVTVQFSSAVSAVEILPDRSGQAQGTVKGGLVTLSLREGEGAVLRLTGKGLASHSWLLKRWAYNASAFTPHVLHHEQYNFYDHNYASLPDPSFTFASADAVAALSAEDAERLRLAGFNVAVATVVAGDFAAFSASLNAAMHWGLFLLGDLGGTQAIGIAQAQAAFACHPALAGYTLPASQAPLSQSAAALLLAGGRRQLLLAPCASPAACADSGRNGAPVAPLVVKAAGADLQNVSGVVWQLAKLSAAAPPLSGFSPHLLIDVQGNASEAVTRFIAYSSLAYGISGLWWRGAQPSSPLFTTIADIQHNLTNWLTAPGSEPFPRRPLFARRYCTGWPVAGASAPGPGELVQAMDGALLVTVLEDPSGVTPPLLYMVDKSFALPATSSLLSLPAAASAPREAWIQLDSSRVASYQFIAGDAAQGFTHCKRSNLGSRIQVSLTPGGAALVGLSMYAD